MLMPLIASGLFGLIIGSFLNVCIYRIPRKLSVIRPNRSFCPQCSHHLGWKENIPVLSWLLLGAKCRSCKAPISGQYPLVELLSAVAAMAAYVKFGLTPTGVVIYALLAVLIVITFIDLEFLIIPDVINFPGMIVGLGIGVLAEFTNLFHPPITGGATDSLLGLLLGGGLFYLMTDLYFRFTGKIGLGGGDVKFMAFIGALLGPHAILPTVFAGSLFGSVIGIGMILFGKGGRHSEIPFGPWLALGVVLHLFDQIPFFRFT